MSTGGQIDEQTTSPHPPKGTGVFFGPVAATCFRNGNNGSTDNKSKKQGRLGRRSLSYNQLPSTAASAGTSRAGPRHTSTDAQQPPRRRASCDLLVVGGNAAGGLPTRSSSFTAMGGRGTGMASFSTARHSFPGMASSGPSTTAATTPPTGSLGEHAPSDVPLAAYLGNNGGMHALQASQQEQEQQRLQLQAQLSQLQLRQQQQQQMQQQLHRQLQVSGTMAMDPLLLAGTNSLDQMMMPPAQQQQQQQQHMMLLGNAGSTSYDARLSAGSDSGQPPVNLNMGRRAFSMLPTGEPMPQQQRQQGVSMLPDDSGALEAALDQAIDQAIDQQLKRLLLMKQELEASRLRNAGTSTAAARRSASGAGGPADAAAAGQRAALTTPFASMPGSAAILQQGFAQQGNLQVPPGLDLVPSNGFSSSPVLGSPFGMRVASSTDPEYATIGSSSSGMPAAREATIAAHAANAALNYASSSAYTPGMLAPQQHPLLVPQLQLLDGTGHQATASSSPMVFASQGSSAMGYPDQNLMSMMEQTTQQHMVQDSDAQLQELQELLAIQQQLAGSFT